MFRRYLSIFFKTRFGVFPPVTCWRETVESLPSFRLLVISSLVFSETLKLSFMLKAIYSYVWQSWIFLKKSPSGKNDQKWPKHMAFGHFKKIKSLALSAFCVKSKFLWFINIWKNCILGKNLVLKLKTKVALRQWDFSVL